MYVGIHDELNVCRLVRLAEARARRGFEVSRDRRGAFCAPTSAKRRRWTLFVWPRFA